MFEFDGILLKPCLLQPCFHVAGNNIGNNDMNNKAPMMPMAPMAPRYYSY